MRSERLKEIKEKHGVEFVIAFHHAIREQCYLDLSHLAGDNVTLISNSDISHYIRESDILITDYSSIFIDFFFQNKPVIFYRFDEDDESLGIDDQADIASSALQTRRIFNVFGEKEEVFDRLERYIKNNFRPEATELKKMSNFFYEKEAICSKVMQQIQCQNQAMEAIHKISK